MSHNQSNDIAAEKEKWLIEQKAAMRPHIDKLDEVLEAAFAEACESAGMTPEGHRARHFRVSEPIRIQGDEIGEDRSL